MMMKPKMARTVTSKSPMPFLSFLLAYTSKRLYSNTYKLQLFYSEKFEYFEKSFTHMSRFIAQTAYVVDFSEQFR